MSRYDRKYRRRSPWLTALKVSAWCLGILILLCGIALWIVTAYFTPSHITKLIEKESGKYINGDVKIGSLDYRLFSTYPWLSIEVDSLQLISHSLDNVSQEIRNKIPEDADMLASVEKIKAQINIHSFLHDEINLRNIEIVKPFVNIVIVNDSVSNFNIAKKMPKVKKVPDIQLTEMNVVSPVDLRFFSLSNEISAAAAINSFYLARNSNKFYDIGFEGAVKGRYKDYSVDDEIPIKFKTAILPSLKDISVELNNLSVSLAGIAFDAKGSLVARNSGIDLKDAEFDVRIEDIFTLLKYLPGQIRQFIQLPEGLEGILPLEVSASLLEPYHFNPSEVSSLRMEDLPAIRADVTISDADLSLLPPGGKRIYANDVYFEAVANFNPKDSLTSGANNIIIKELRMEGEGVSLSASAEIDNVLGYSRHFEGRVHFSSPLMETLAYLMPKSAMKIAGKMEGNLKFNGESLGNSEIKNIDLSGDMMSKSLKVNSTSIGGVVLKNMNGKFEAKIPEYPLKDYAGTKLDLDFRADSLTANSGGARISIANIDFSLDAADTLRVNPDPFGDICLKIKSLNASSGGTLFSASDIDVQAQGALTSTPQGNYTTVAATSGGDDAIIASRVKHTPLVVEYEGGGILQTVMGMMNLDADVKIGKGKFKTPDYLYPVEFNMAELSTNLNDVNFSAGNVTISNTGLSMGGKVEGLGAFLTSYSATPLKATADIIFTNVDINRLSWGYYGTLVAQGKDSVFYVPPFTPYTAADSICVAIPRNIDADIRLKANSAEYMQWRFSPLSTRITVKNGDATLGKLTVGAPYATAIVDWTYSTSNLSDIYMDLKAKVVNFRFEPFYKIFPSILQKAPELHNFTGIVNADVNCYFRMFPDMFMNMESLKGNFDINASALQFAREGKIEKITHLMLIEGDQPIKIDNIHINGTYHDNLLQLNPFRITFDDYQLGFAGINNIAGDMYYHVALEKSPFHMPFGVSVFGKMKHPEIRLGGTHIDDYRTERVSADVEDNVSINIMAYLRNGWQLFVQEAAKYAERNSE